uniref:Uncharacterized protein n=1 Tax=Anopheles albimanus TaxID=7167 RepID=A0A182F4H3_ANOAL
MNSELVGAGGAFLHGVCRQHPRAVCYDGRPQKELFKSVRQLQQDMAQIKVQLADERTQRAHLQQLLVGHLETYGAANTTC